MTKKELPDYWRATPGAKLINPHTDYPADWPRCPVCNDFALQDHITCGRVLCNEGEQRRKRADAYAAQQRKKKR